MSNNMTFSERLRFLRMEEGITQTDLSQALGVSAQSYSAYENGREPNFTVLKEIAKRYNVSIDYLLGVSDTCGHEKKRKNKRDYNEFKGRLRFLREKNSLSVAQLGSLFNKTESAVRTWEQGRSKPDADTLVKLAEYFKCTTDYLLALDDFKNREERAEYNDGIGDVLINLEKCQAEVRTSVLSIVNTFASAPNRYVELNATTLAHFLSGCENIITALCDALDIANCNHSNDDCSAQLVNAKMTCYLWLDRIFSYRSNLNIEEGV